MRTELVPIALLSLVFVACSSLSRVEDAPDTAPGDPLERKPGTESAASQLRLRGVLVPAEFASVSLWPETYSGELLVLEVLPHGAEVEQGDVVARLDTETIEEQIADAELELASARTQHQALIEKNAIAEEAAASQLDRTRAALDRAQRSLTGYETREREFSERSDELARRREESRLEDQRDELAQLEAMYEADELTDATEEIVLKRSRRDVALLEAGNVLSEDRRGYRVELSDALEAEAKREDVARKAEELEHLVRTQAIDARSRADAVARSEAALAKKETKLAELRRDGELLTVRAPRAGVLLHGTARDLRSGGGPKVVERGSRLTARAGAFVIADPGRLDVAVDVLESQRPRLPDGAAVTARPTALPDVALSGTLQLATFPGSVKGEESAFEGTVHLAESAPGLVLGTHVTVEPAVAQ